MSDQRPCKESRTTPPSNLAGQPLTPPPSESKAATTVDQILQEIEDRRSGCSLLTNPWLQYALSVSHYRVLESQLETDSFVEDKLRFDYLASSEVFVLRMPSALHEALRSSTVDEIVHQLRSIARGEGPSSDFARRIKHCGSASITFGDSAYGRHQPDDSFQYLGARYPNVVIELSYSQKRKDLIRLADDYILGSDGNIRVVIGFDIDYKDKSATLSMWRPRLQTNKSGKEELIAHQVLSNKEFRNANGEVNSGTPFRLQLGDFVPPSLLPQDAKLDQDISISSADLCSYILDADQLEVDMKHQIGVAETLKPGVRKRRHSSSPIEQLQTDDELDFKRREERDAKRNVRTKTTKGADSVRMQLIPWEYLNKIMSRLRL